MADQPLTLHPGGDAAPAELTDPTRVAPAPTRTLDEARALARERFKEKVAAGEKVGDCNCHDPAADSAEVSAPGVPAARAAGIRFRDSGRVYYFAAAGFTLATGDWVVIETARGREAGRVVIAPHQVRLDRLQGDLKPILRVLGADDLRRMDGLKKDGARAVRVFSERARARRVPLKAISADYSFDGGILVLNYSTQDRPELRDLHRELADHFGCRVELRQVGPRDEARLLGGLGRCGRTLCCSSWLPVYPEISMGMAKTQDLALNPGKVSGVCGRLLCCLSYENEQYKQMKAVLPRLGQPIETPAGPGMVVSLQVIKELVTVRLAHNNTDVVFPGAELHLGGAERTPPADQSSPPPPSAPDHAGPSVVAAAAPVPVLVPTTEPDQPAVPVESGEMAAEGDASEPATSADGGANRRRRRRRGRGGRGGAAASGGEG